MSTNPELEAKLAKWLPNLQCFNCKAVPGPPPNKRKRFICMVQHHPICPDCNGKTCPCNSAVSPKPSETIELLLTELPWYCQSYKNGCREIFSNVEQLEKHQNSCVFRNVQCPRLLCQASRKLFIYKDLFLHLSEHGNERDLENWIEKNSDGIDESYMSGFIVNRGFTCSTPNDGAHWPHLRFETEKEGVFWLVSKIFSKAAYFAVYYYGSEEDAKFLRATISLGSTFEGEYHTLEGKVFVLDTTIEEIVSSHRTFCIPCHVLERLVKTENKLSIKITNMKDFIEENLQREEEEDAEENEGQEEEEEESGVSDEEDNKDGQTQK